MKQAQFVKNAIFQALKARGYSDYQAQSGADAGERHYLSGSNFKPNALDACLQYALRFVGKAKK